MGGDAYYVLIAAIFGGAGLKFIDVWLNSKKYQADRALASAERSKRLYLENTLTPEDEQWVARMLQAGEISPEAVQTCSCGFMAECVIHCNHEMHPDCVGERWSGRII